MREQRGGEERRGEERGKEQRGSEENGWQEEIQGLMSGRFSEECGGCFT
jgi:hypothetical protein